MTDEVPIELISAGEYAVPGSPYYILKTAWDGPKGGQTHLWEIATKPRSGYEVRSTLGYRTLRDARKSLAGKVS